MDSKEAVSDKTGRQDLPQRIADLLSSVSPERAEDANGVGREHLTLYIVTEGSREITGKRRENLRFFVFDPVKKHNILCPAKKRLLFSLFFSGKWKLSGAGSCGIMTVTDEFGRGKL